MTEGKEELDMTLRIADANTTTPELCQLRILVYGGFS